MRTRLITVVHRAVGLSIVSVPLFAHHANAVFDIGKRVTLKGTVTEWFWANPHCLLRVDVKDDRGNGGPLDWRDSSAAEHDPLWLEQELLQGRG